MSRKTFLEALEGVLRREMELREEMMILRPGVRQALEADERDIALPDLGDAAFSAAVGIAMCGMRPVLDLRHTPDAAAVLLDSVSALTPGFAPDMTILTGAEDAELLMELSGLRVFYPQTPRQAAGFIRAALRGDRICLLIADEELAGMEDDVPDDDDFMLMPLSAADPMSEEDGETGEDTDPAEDSGVADEDTALAEFPEETDEDSVLAGPCGGSDGEAASAGSDADVDSEEFSGETDKDGVLSEASGEADEGSVLAGPCAGSDGEAASAETFDEPDEEMALTGSSGGEAASADSNDSADLAEPSGDAGEAIVPAAAISFRPAMRSVPWNAGRLRSLAEERDMDEERLAARCMERVAGRGSVEWTYEADSLSGECAFLPVQDGQAHLWIGCDRLCLTWNAEALAGREAAGILRAAMRMLEKPTLLIYDKEDEAE